MKKIILCCAALAAAVAGASAQNFIIQAETPDTLAGESLMVIRHCKADSRMAIEIGGIDISLAPPRSDSAAVKPLRAKRYATFLSKNELGFAALTGTSYGAYAPEDGHFLNTETFRSFHFSSQLVGVNFALNRKRTLSLEVGFQFTIDNYRLSSSDRMLGREEGRIVPADPYEPDPRLSKFVTTSVGIPVRLLYEPGKHWNLALTAYSDFGTGITSVTRSPHITRDLRGLRAYQFGVGASVSCHGVGLFVRYNVSPLFRSGAGPECHPLSFGVSLLW